MARKTLYKNRGGRRARFTPLDRLVFGAMCEYEPMRQTKIALRAGNTENKSHSTAILATKALVEKMKKNEISSKALAMNIHRYAVGEDIPSHIEDLLLDKKHDDGANMFVWRNSTPSHIYRKDILKAVQKRIKNDPSYVGNPPSIHFLEKAWAEYRKFSLLDAL